MTARIPLREGLEAKTIYDVSRKSVEGPEFEIPDIPPGQWEQLGKYDTSSLAAIVRDYHDDPDVVHREVQRKSGQNYVTLEMPATTQPTIDLLRRLHKDNPKKGEREVQKYLDIMQKKRTYVFLRIRQETLYHMGE